jgi:F0F1-type ATP synthase membrane subunit c/vacuolar-type H+-ATPase subunit K
MYLAKGGCCLGLALAHQNSGSSATSIFIETPARSAR